MLRAGAPNVLTKLSPKTLYTSVKYPYNHFIKAVAKSIDTKRMIPSHVIDAPCGNGYTSIELGKIFPDLCIEGVDIENHFLNTKQNNVSFLAKDIHQYIDNQPIISFMCIINSLYLLPNPIELLQKIFSKLEKNGQLVLIIPNIESQNFKRFQDISPSINTFLPSKNDFDSLLQQLGFEIVANYPIVFTPFYGRWDTKILFFMRHQYLHFLEKRNEKKQNRIGSYWVLVLQKN